MPRMETKYSIFIASPSDVARERDVVVEVVSELNITFRPRGIQFEVLRWENDVRPAMGSYGQGVVNDQIGQEYDIFLGIMWNTVGSKTPAAESGTIEEYAGRLETQIAALKMAEELSARAKADLKKLLD